MYEQPFKPTEVTSLAAILPKPPNIYEMASAQILGDREKSNELDEKPTLYSTIVTSHPTSVVHPPKPIGHPMLTDSASASMFTNVEEQLPPGSFRSKVKIGNIDLEDNNIKNPEKPVFLGKGEKTNNTPVPGTTQKITNTVQTAANLDVNTIKQHLTNLKLAERNKKLDACKFVI